MFVVVSLDDNMVGGLDKGFHIVVRFAAVGSDHEALSAAIDDVAETVGRIVADTKGGYLHIKEGERYAFFDVFTRGSQFFLYAIVMVYTLMDQASGIDRQVNAFTECANGTDMVGVVVGDEYTHDVAEIEVHLAEAFLDGTRRYAGIDKDTLLACAEVVAVTTTATGKTAKYDFILLHFRASLSN